MLGLSIMCSKKKRELEQKTWEQERTIEEQEEKLRIYRRDAEQSKADLGRLQHHVKEELHIPT